MTCHTCVSSRDGNSGSMVLTSGPQWSPGGQLASAAGRSGFGRTCEHNNVEGRHDGGDLVVWRLSAEARKIQWRGGKMRVKLRSRRHASRGAAQASPATRLAAPFTVVSLFIAVGYCRPRPRPVNGFLSPGQKKVSPRLRARRGARLQATGADVRVPGVGAVCTASSRPVGGRRRACTPCSLSRSS